MKLKIKLKIKSKVSSLGIKQPVVFEEGEYNRENHLRHYNLDIAAITVSRFELVPSNC